MVKAPKFCHVSHPYSQISTLANALNINFFSYLQSSYHCSTYLSAQLDLCSASLCYSLLICCHPLSTTYIFFSKNHQSLISLCITSSLESTSCLNPPALHKHPAPLSRNGLHSLIYLPPAHHSHPPSQAAR